MSNKTIAILVAVIAIVAIAAVALATMGGGNDDTKDSPVGTYSLVHNEILELDQGEEGWFEDYGLEAGQLVIESYEGNIVKGSWFDVPFEGIYDSEDKMTFTIMTQGLVETVMAVYDDGAVYMTSLSFMADSGLYDYVQAYGAVLAKDGIALATPEVTNPFEEGDVFIEASKKTVYLDNYFAEDSFGRTLDIVGSKGGLMLARTYDPFGDPIYTVFASVQEGMFLGLSYTDGTEIVETSLIYVDGTVVTDSWSVMSDFECIEVCVYTEDGEDPAFKGPDSLIGNIYSDGVHSASIMNAVGNVTTVVMQDGAAHLMVMLWNGESFDVMTAGLPAFNGYRLYAESFGTVSKDLSEMTMTSVVYGDPLKAFVWEMDLLEDDGIVGLYLTSSVSRVGTDDDGFNVDYVNPTVSYLLVLSCDDGIVKGKWWGIPFVGTFDGEMLSFFVKYESHGIEYIETVFAHKFGDGFVMYSTYSKEDNVFAALHEYTKAGPDVIDENGMVAFLVDENGEMFVPTMLLDTGDVLTSVGGYSFTKDGITEYSDDTTIVVELSSGGLYKLAMSGDSEADLVGFQFIGDILWLAGSSPELLATYQLNIHDDVICLGRNTLFDGVYETHVTRFVTDDMTGSMPDEPVLEGKFTGTKAYSIVDGEKYTDYLDGVTVILHGQKGFVGMMDDIVIHSITCQDKTLFVYADRAVFGAAECYMDCYGVFSDDGSVLTIYGHGMDQDTGLGYAVVFDLMLSI